MFLSHYRAGTGAVCVETREERRLLRALLAELPSTAQVMTCAAPGGALIDARTGRKGEATGLMAGYAWLAGAPGRVLVVYDWHVLANAPGHWRALIEALPGLRSPKGAGAADAASLVVFVAPSWELTPQNPLRGSLPVLQFEAPRRAELSAIAEALAPLNGSAEHVADALGGLTAESAEQAAAECLAAHGGQWNPEYLRSARKQLIRESGLELWPTTADLGGLGGLKSFCDAELFPWIRHALAPRRLLMAGLPGVGKSYCARWIADRLKCECARLSIPALKAGLVGASEANLRRALRAIDALAAESPIVVVLDEIDTIARDGLDGGTSSGMFAELLTWINETTSQAVILGTLNRLDKLDAAMESRFQARFFFDLPTLAERRDVARIRYAELGCEPDALDTAAAETARHTEGYSSREIAKNVCESALRRSNLRPTANHIIGVTAGLAPSSVTQADQLKSMRAAANALRRANDPDDSADPHASRRVLS